MILAPPSTYSTLPVSRAEPGSHRNAAASPTSSIVAISRSGAACVACSISRSNSRIPLPARVLIGPGEIALAGWASLPAPDRQADVVLLCVTDAQGEPQIVEMAPVGSPRPDKAAALGEPAATCGWALRAPIGTFLGRQTPATVTAWAFDAEHRELFPLAGTVTLGR